jgi:hypothetical protein
MLLDPFTEHTTPVSFLYRSFPSNFLSFPPSDLSIFTFLHTPAYIIPFPHILYHSYLFNTSSPLSFTPSTTTLPFYVFDIQIFQTTLLTYYHSCLNSAVLEVLTRSIVNFLCRQIHMLSKSKFQRPETDKQKVKLSG